MNYTLLVFLASLILFCLFALIALHAQNVRGMFSYGDEIPIEPGDILGDRTSVCACAFVGVSEQAAVRP